MKIKVLASVFLCAMLVTPTAFGHGRTSLLLKRVKELTPNHHAALRHLGSKELKAIRSIEVDGMDRPRRLSPRMIETIRNLDTDAVEAIRNLDPDIFFAITKGEDVSDTAHNLDAHVVEIMRNANFIHLDDILKLPSDVHETIRNLDADAVEAILKLDSKQNPTATF